MPENPAQRQVQLRPMSQDQFQEFVAASRSRFVAQAIGSGTASYLEAERQCDETMSGVITGGLQTPRQYFRTITCLEYGYIVGEIWFGEAQGREGVAYIYDFHIQDRFRRRGYGSAAIRASERELASQGYSRVRLHVFGTNTEARRLYEEGGFRETNVYLEKRLDRPDRRDR